MKADIPPVIDRGEQAWQMDPLLIARDSSHRPELDGIALKLAVASEGFLASLPKGMVKPLADLVRAMNCYYSNLIEGHDTHPVDIERALANDYSADPVKRDLQQEARAHIEVQRWIDEGNLDGRTTMAVAICEVHRRFCEALPADLLVVSDPDTGEELAVVPGELRQRDVKIGRHVPVSPGAIPRFLSRFEETYGGVENIDAILSVAAAHHRLLWIHPFLDGNGRVARLISHAMFREILGTHGIWSAARGLARSVEKYKRQLVKCDQGRRNDLDGRGALSEEALAEFTMFFLDVCLDQVNFMRDLVRPDRLHERILRWAEEEVQGGRLPSHAKTLLQAVLFRGELERRDVAPLLATTDRHARRIVAALTEIGVLQSGGVREPLYLAFRAALAPRWMPGLFPEA